MSIPRATVRLQLHRDFPFDAALEIVPYLAKLGISHIYASPILSAHPGSTHGYDTIDPTAINPELGGRPGLDRLASTLRRHDMGLIIDIVPNHMAAVAENPWWWDVLKHGRGSRYAQHFDIDWDDADLQGKVLLPCLGDPLEACLARGEVTMAEDGREIRYFDHRFPIDPQTLSDDAALQALLERQHYRLAFWREAATRINWRRFFDINQLVALRMERDEVFNDYHRLILALCREGVIDGVRVDHVDGLAEPIAYCRRLRQALRTAAPGRDPYLVVEKILHGDERLSPDWEIHGTTGYDFLDQVSAVLHDPAGEPALTTLWQQTSGDDRAFAAVARDARSEILDRLFPRQRDRLLEILHGAMPKADARLLRRALTTLLSALQHYRLYGADSGFDAADTQELDFAINAVRPLLDGETASLLGELCDRLPRTPVRQRFEQLSATLTAKAVEDTAFYRYGRLLSRNEVGSDPGVLAFSVERFHAAAAGRLASFPAAMLATATHDTKRGEDHRARLAVLSERAEEWQSLAARWLQHYPAPEPGVGLMIWQTIIGGWPPHCEPAAFLQRLQQWLVKALREAKQRTAWDSPNEDFERACTDYLASLFDPGRSFLPEAEAFVARIAPAGIRNSLAQTLLRLTMPGVPDLYQGTEFWDFSLVDPDNRRPVDFKARADALSAEPDLPALLQEWRDGRIKQAMIARLLQFRQRHPRLFAEGSYQPLAVSGPKAAHVIAFSRRLEAQTLIVAIPRLTAGLHPATGGVWQGTEIAVPQIGAVAQDLLRPRALGMEGGIAVAALFDALPLAALAVSDR